MGIGTIITAATLGHTDPVLQWTLAAIAGGGTAGVMGTLASLTRLTSTGITGGLGNFIVATIEAVGSISLSILGISFPERNPRHSWTVSEKIILGYVQTT